MEREGEDGRKVSRKTCVLTYEDGGDAPGAEA